MSRDLKALSRADLLRLLEGLGQPPWQADEVRRRIFVGGVREIGGLTSLPKPVRERLGQAWRISAPEVAASRRDADGTRKYLLRFEDGAACETVLIPQPGRLTQCLSSQAGCSLGCAFCRTGRLGLRRNLRAFEIIDQWLVPRRTRPREAPVTNLVFMGMGEPLLNRDALEEALRFFTSSEGAAISASRITVSTAGIPPGIDWLADRLPRVKLAVSLNAPGDELRSRLMPVNRRYPLSELMAALRLYPATRHPITIEYVLLGGVNDAPAQAAQLARLVRGLRCKVNLIPFNPHSGLPFRAPAEDAVLAFQAVLARAGLRALVRRSQGTGIRAACGQLG